MDFIQSFSLPFNEVIPTQVFAENSVEVMGCDAYANCSGHGDCFHDKCACLVKYTGGSCNESNFGYFVSFGCIFIFLCVVATIQLIICVKNEYVRQRRKSLKEAAFKITAQKLLYALIIIACLLRGVYFFTKEHISELASTNLWTLYYPILLSCFSFLVCFWAEAFHLDIDKPRFLSKSFIGFAVFNFVIYTMLCMHLVLIDTSTDPKYNELVTKVINGCFAGMMILSVVFFLIYGVQVYFKVHGAFRGSNSHIDSVQLHMSRFGLIMQAVLQLILALFMLSDIANGTQNLTVLSQNFYDICFRIAEFGVALWFPCVLWNCKSPEDLWVLNPKKLLKSFRFRVEEKETDPLQSKQYTGYGSCNTAENKYDCWICYDPERTDAGPLIQPCNCKGDVTSVHHECLKKWLLECMENDEEFRCKVCRHQYQLHVGWGWMPRGLKVNHWIQMIVILAIMVGCPFVAFVITNTFSQTFVDVLAIGSSLLTEFICMRFLVSQVGMCYKRGRLSTISILGRQISYQQTEDHSQPSSSIEPPVPSTKEIQITKTLPNSVHETDVSDDSRVRNCSISVEAVIENRDITVI